MTAPTNPTLFEKIGEHMMFAMYFDLFRYVVAAGGLFVLLLVLRRWAENRRIQQRKARGADYRREILSSIRTVFFFAVTTISTLLMREAGIINLELESIAVLALVAQIVVMIVAHDAYFYWLHRAMHHPRLFRPMHLHHHKSRTPTPWTAYSFSVWEAILEAAFVPLYLLAASLAGVDYAVTAVLFFIWIQIVRNVMQHAGVELHPAGWVDSKWTDWISTTTHHDLHHSTGNHNFGFYFTFWDRWMGTEHPEYKQRFREAAKPLVITRGSKLRLAERMSTIAMALLAAAATVNMTIETMGAGSLLA